MIRDDNTIENLLDLDKTRFVIDDRHGLWVKFEARQIEKTRERPHGIRYSLTLHDRFNNRILGFDNSHAVENKNQQNITCDHWHRDNTDEGRPYHFKSAADLLHDFWRNVDKFVNQLNET